MLPHEASGSRHRRKRQRRGKEEGGVLGPSFDHVSKPSGEISTSRSRPATGRKAVHHLSKGLISPRGNGHSLEKPSTSGIARTTCAVCRNCHSFARPLSASMEKLNESKERECPTCTLIIRGISKFFESLPPETPGTFAPSAVKRVTIYSSKWESLSIRLEFNDHHPGFDLDFFTLNGILFQESSFIFTS